MNCSSARGLVWPGHTIGICREAVGVGVDAGADDMVAVDCKYKVQVVNRQSLKSVWVWLKTCF